MKFSIRKFNKQSL